MPPIFAFIFIRGQTFLPSELHLEVCMIKDIYLQECKSRNEKKQSYNFMTYKDLRSIS